jgi:hypothetical protein
MTTVNCDFILIHNDKGNIVFRFGIFNKDPITKLFHQVATKFICLMASVISRSISSPSTRRVHYQSQISNASFSLSQSFSPNEFSNINEPFSSSFVYSNPLVTVIYSTTSLSKGML